ncbi:MAG TPA: hypothetical protein VNF47_27100 [Streptosporangiaceae bacterium]|nr:hypothetical protein [Streptosporangiaceae bacterium]
MRLRRISAAGIQPVRRVVVAAAGSLAVALVLGSADAGPAVPPGHPGLAAPGGRAAEVGLTAARTHGRDPGSVLPPALAGLLAGVPAPLVSRFERLLAAERGKAALRPPSWLLAGLSPAARQQVEQAFAKPAAAGSGCLTEKLPGVPAEAIVVGFSNVTKLHGASLLGPALTKLDIGTSAKFCQAFFEEDGTAVLDFHGRPQFPPVRATLLAFGFVPVTATLLISQIGTGDLAAIATSTPAPGGLAVIRERLMIKVESVRVNGVPLAVGPHCGTSRPVNGILAGFDPTNGPGPNYYRVNFGGPLTGTITFPPFSGCGVGDDLNPIFTASISGSPNFVKITQGRICNLAIPVNPDATCPPPVPVPLR